MPRTFFFSCVWRSCLLLHASWRYWPQVGVWRPTTWCAAARIKNVWGCHNIPSDARMHLQWTNKWIRICICISICSLWWHSGNNMLDVMCLCVGAAATMLSLGIRANGICILCMDGAWWPKQPACWLVLGRCFELSQHTRLVPQQPRVFVCQGLELHARNE